MIDDIRPLAHALEQLVAERHVGTSSRHAAVQVSPLVLRSARKLVPLIYRQLEPALTPELLVEWKQAVSLGRVHRPKALPSRGLRRLPAGNRRSLAQEQRSTRGILRRAMLWLLGAARTSPPHRLASTDYDVTEIKRLVAPNTTQIGVDGDRQTTS